MEISMNYGVRRYFISDNYFYCLVFVVSLCFFLKQKRKKQRDMEKTLPTSPLNSRGGDNDNSVVLQRVYDQCLSHGDFVEVTDTKMKQLIRKMLHLKP